MKTSIIIPNYNGSDLLQKNIPIVLKSVEKYKDVEVIVVDDASTDNSLEILNSFGTRAIIVRNEKNVGFAQSVNKGVEKAQGDIVVLLNSDVQPRDNFLEPLLKHFENEKVFAVGCLDESIENGKSVSRGRGIGKWKRGFLLHAAGSLDKHTTLWANGGSSAFRKNIWEQLKGLSSLYRPFYWEDIDLSYRAWKQGYEVVFEPKSVVVHEHEKGAIKKNFTPFYIKSVAYKNQFIFVWRNIRDLDLVLSHLLWLPYHFLVTLKNFDLAFLFGFLRALFTVPNIIQSNISMQSKHKASDKEILSLFVS